MYNIIDNNLSRCQEWVSNNYNVCGTEFTAAIGLQRNKELICVTGYNHFNGKSCHVHYYLKEKSYVPKSYVWYVHYYPFIQNGLDMLIAIVDSSNKSIIKLIKNLGYDINSVIQNAHINGDLTICVLTKNRCRFLGDSYARW